MDFNFASIRKGRFLLGVLFTIALFFSHGCSSEGETQIIDFSKTIPVEQPREKPHGIGALRVAVGAMVSPRETFVYYHKVLNYIGRHLNRDTVLIQRKTYGEINQLLGKGLIDLAFICSGPYALEKEKYGFELLATPRVQGSHFYHAYLIVNRDSPLHLLEELRGRTFAFTDPDSNTGRLVPLYWLAQMKEQPETFFKKTIYTYSHDNSILAVARNLVDGASIDGLVWEYYNSKNPDFTAATRIIKKSKPYGIPPLVTARYLSTELKERIKRVVLSMHRDPEGQIILKELMIDRFIPPMEAWYEHIRTMKRELTILENKRHASEKS